MTNTTTSTDFKPCPFCGGDDLVLCHWSPWVGTIITHVKCDSCGATTPAAIWNQRSPMAEVQEIMEEVNK